MYRHIQFPFRIWLIIHLNWYHKRSPVPSIFYRDSIKKSSFIITSSCARHYTCRLIIIMPDIFTLKLHIVSVFLWLKWSKDYNENSFVCLFSLISKLSLSKEFLLKQVEPANIEKLWSENLSSYNCNNRVL